MPRRNRPPKRIPPPDVKYRQFARGDVHQSDDAWRQEKCRDSVSCTRRLTRWANGRKRIRSRSFEIAIRNVTPAVEVKPKRVGGSTYQVPIDVSHERGVALAMRWLIQFARDRSGRSMAEKLTNELLRCLQWARQRDPQERRDPSYGGGEPRLCPLPLRQQLIKRDDLDV